MNRVVLPSKQEGETITVTFDFGTALVAGETISSASTSATTYSGTDASPSAIVNGSATISGEEVKQSLTGGEEGVTYDVVCTTNTSAGQILQIAAFLCIVPTP